MGQYKIMVGDGGLDLFVHGWGEWALPQLMSMGELGCTPIHNPAPRRSSYVQKLRKQGLDIETLHESHHGSFPGHLARYIWRCSVQPIDQDETEAQLPQRGRAA